MHFTSVIRHSWHSLAEGAPAFMRIIMDQYTGYVSNSDYVKTNYTGGQVRWAVSSLLPSLVVRDDKLRQGSMLDIKVCLSLRFNP